jgi:hypothetical protein
LRALLALGLQARGVGLGALSLGLGLLAGFLDASLNVGLNALPGFLLLPLLGIVGAPLGLSLQPPHLILLALSGIFRPSSFGLDELLGLVNPALDLSLRLLLRLRVRPL